MRVLGLDLEATSLDVNTARIVELGLCLWDTETNSPLITEGTFVYCEEMEEEISKDEVREMLQRVCGIDIRHVREFGIHPQVAFNRIFEICEKYGVEFIVAHNGSGYDQPLLLTEMKRYLSGLLKFEEIPWIDTRTDLPFDVEPDSRKLKHMALEAGFINPFPHRALFDVMTMLKVMSQFPIEDIMGYRAVPWVVVRAMVSYDDRQLAKDARFMWEKVADKTYPKCWVKRIKQDQLEKERKDAKFSVVVIDE